MTGSTIIAGLRETYLTLASAEIHIRAGRVSPELTAACKAWVGAGRPLLSKWLGEPDDDEEGESDGGR